MAYALGFEYWVLPRISAFYVHSYHIDELAIADVLRLVTHILRSKGLHHIVQSRDEL